MVGKGLQLEDGRKGRGRGWREGRRMVGKVRGLERGEKYGREGAAAVGW